MEIVVYSKAGCPFCSLLKMELGKRDLPYTVIDLSDDSLRKEFYQNAGVQTVPQLYLTTEPYSAEVPSGERIGGYTEVTKDWAYLLESMG